MEILPSPKEVTNIVSEPTYRGDNIQFILNKLNPTNDNRVPSQNALTRCQVLENAINQNAQDIEFGLKRNSGD